MAREVGSILDSAHNVVLYRLLLLCFKGLKAVVA